MEIQNSRIWVTGAYGRVGSAISGLLDTADVELLKTDIDDVDITSAEAVNLYMDLHRPHIVINCAGMTDVQACEENREAAFKVNAIGARNLSTASRRINARLIQLSTDDVFGGQTKMPYNEFDKTDPITMYGKSKLAGENFVRELSPKHMIIRSSWLYGTGNNFVTQLLKKAESSQTIEVSNNQFAAPTSAKELATLMIRIIENGEDGVYHGVCQGYCSRYEFAQEIIRLSGKNTEIVPALDNKDYEIDMRPSYSVLDNLMLRICEIPEPVHWKAALAEFMKEITIM